MDTTQHDQDAQQPGDHQGDGGHNDRLMHTVATLEQGWRQTFLDTLRETGNLARSAQAAHVTRRRVYQAIEQDEDFAEAVEACRQTVLDDLEEALASRGKRSDTPAAIAYLKAKRPLEWDRARQVDVTTTSYVHEVKELRQHLTVDQARELLAKLEEATPPKLDAEDQVAGNQGGSPPVPSPGT